ncbi:hypothetical protein B9Q32_19075 [Enterobacter kobei]|nr:hypothetical protein B9Q32_19075 [Enterobacter kobei]
MHHGCCSYYLNSRVHIKQGIALLYQYLQIANGNESGFTIIVLFKTVFILILLSKFFEFTF